MSKNVLIVDDEQDVCDVLRVVLERRGITVRTAYDGHEALDEIDRQRPDLILLDLKMPRLNGYQLFAQLKSDPRHQSIPILVITALTQESDRDDEEWARRMGADGFLTKPFDLDDLGRRIDEMIANLL